MPEEVDLDAELCDRIVHMVHDAAGYNINIMGSGGVILASSDPSRVGKVHEGAKRIMAGEIGEIAIDPESAARMTGVKPGYNGGVRYKGRLLASIGISGDPSIVKPVQKMAEVVLIQEMERRRLAQGDEALLKDVRAEISDIAEEMQVISLNGAVLAARLGDKGRGFKVVVGEMRRLAEQIAEKVLSLDVRRGSR
jgi:carbohydrate diacid regulator